MAALLLLLLLCVIMVQSMFASSSSSLCLPEPPSFHYSLQSQSPILIPSNPPLQFIWKLWYKKAEITCVIEKLLTSFVMEYGN
ncbi:hypothetical protein D0Y65_023464 [Glycine soja]|uniref:Uncharacterized protein n=1 Tax=Glycine soja TaxID=3848 RepID=A0A445IY53_GLYSO|nr:hypothetical protein D0Y65_023464 [Glycine soja]